MCDCDVDGSARSGSSNFAVPNPASPD